jgi:ABC-type nitrate/sulfonate/bicarbonate transport system permease component
VSQHKVFEIRRPVSRNARIALGLTSWALLITAWYLITHWDILPPFSLPRPAGVVQAFVRLWT